MKGTAPLGVVDQFEAHVFGNALQMQGFFLVGSPLLGLGHNGHVGWAATTGNVCHQEGDVTTMTRSSAGYNAWTGNAWRTSAGMSYNSRTGNLSAGQRSAVGNVYTGNYAYGGRGSSVNTRARSASSWPTRAISVASAGCWQEG